MKKLLTTIAIAATLTAPVLAEEKVTCENVAGLAESVMQGRQNGVDMVKMIEVAGDSGLAKLLVMEAYKQPKFDTARYKQDRISEFKNMVYRECLTARRDKS